MSSLSSLEAYDLLRFSELLEERLALAEVAQACRKGLEREKAWLSEAFVLLRTARAAVPPILERARDLPELTEVREDYAEEMQAAWVDALEKVHAGITFHAGSRAPVIEALFPHQKFPALRKASPDGIRAYAAEFERRSRMGYVKRIFGQPDFAFLVPVVLEVPAALLRWEACFEPSTMSEEQAAPIRDELAEAAYRLDRVMRQARLLAEAALLPVLGAFEESGIGARPRRRVGTVPTEAPFSDEGAILDDGISLAEALGMAAPSEEQADGGPGAPGTGPEDAAPSEATAAAGEASPSGDPAVEAGARADAPAGPEASVLADAPSAGGAPEAEESTPSVLLPEEAPGAAAPVGPGAESAPPAEPASAEAEPAARPRRARRKRADRTSSDA